MSTFEKFTLALQVLTILVAAFTLGAYYWQLRVMSKQLLAMQQASNAQSGLSLVNFLQAADVREARHVVREILSRKPLSEWTPEEREKAAKVVANYDVAAALIRAGLVPIELIATNWGPSILHCHKILQPFIDEKRSQPGSGQQYWSNFDWLSNETIQKTA